MLVFLHYKTRPSGTMLQKQFEKNFRDSAFCKKAAPVLRVVARLLLSVKTRPSN
jgi:hypothetical protein